MKHRTRFHRWLLKRYATESLTLAAQKFGNECNPKVSYTTIQKWADGTKPRDFTRDILRPQFPDCELFALKIQTLPITSVGVEFQVRGPIE